MTDSDVADLPAPAIGWHTGLSDEDQRRIRELIAAARKADGVAPVGDQVLRELSHDRTKHLVALDGDRTVVGYLDLAPATAEGPAMAELVVHPQWRRRGIGSAMARMALAEGGRRHPRSGRTATSSRRAQRRPPSVCTAVLPRAVQMRRPRLRPTCPRRTIPAGVRVEHLPRSRRRRRTAAGQQRRVRLAPRAERVDGRRHRRAPRRAVVRRRRVVHGVRRPDRQAAGIPLDQGAQRAVSARCTWSASTRPRRAVASGRP